MFIVIGDVNKVITKETTMSIQHVGHINRTKSTFKSTITYKYNITCKNTKQYFKENIYHTKVIYNYFICFFAGPFLFLEDL